MVNKAVLITGSSNGLGKEIALVFAEHGWNIILHGRNEDRLDEVYGKIVRKNVGCNVIKGDIALPETINSLYEVAKKKEIDILINNAGVYCKGLIVDIKPEKIKRVLEVNLLAPILLIRELLPIFQRKRSGLIVNVNSMAGKSGAQGETVYSASKHGLRGFSTSLQFEATEDSIRVLDVYSGAIQTDMTTGRADPEKLIKPEEAADCIFRLCKEYSSLRITEIDLFRRKY